MDITPVLDSDDTDAILAIIDLAAADTEEAVTEAIGDIGDLDG